MHFFRLRLVAALLAGILVISVGSTYFDVLAHRLTLRRDLIRRTQWFAAGLEPQLEQQFNLESKQALPNILAHFHPHPDQPGLVLLDKNGEVLAVAGNLVPLRDLPQGLFQKAMNANKETGSFVRIADARSAVGSGARSTHLWFEDIVPLHNDEQTAGALLALADADYIHVEELAVWRRSFLRIAAIVVVVMLVTVFMVRWFLQRPVQRAAEWLRRLRHGEAEVADGAREFGDLIPLAKEVTFLAENLTRARAEAESEARLRDAAENVWTAHRLAVHVRERLDSGKLFVVSNREPYMHVRSGKQTECIVPSSGLVTALEPILQACNGIWVAHGSGNEDAAFVDDHDRIRVPPGEMRYTLRRVWLSKEEETGYYDGFSNEGLWPLCHIAHTRPIFRASDWKHYQNVNQKFADALLEEMSEVEHPVVFVQDYHFALLPGIIKQARPDCRVAIFWHIPWPNAEAFGICPWQTELIDGIVSADLIGFHLQAHCNNFLDTVDHVLESRTDWEHFGIRRNGHYAALRAYPISVAWDEHEAEAASMSADFHGQYEDSAAPSTIRLAASNGKAKFAKLQSDAMPGDHPILRELGIEGQQMILGVDRMDYTKGIVERMLAIEHLLEEYPAYLERIAYVQIASPSRIQIPSYIALRLQVEAAAARINRRFQSSRWQPILLLQRQYSHEELTRYYRFADLCLVTSLHDGMNLVAKEYLAARKDQHGVLVLSRFAGAAHELKDALIVNPYDIEQVSHAIRRGLEMSRGEQHQRMERMRRQVKEHNVYRWASNILSDLCAVRLEEEWIESAQNQSNRRLA